MASGYIMGLADSESKYYSSEAVTEYQQMLDGKIIGIGLDFVKSREDSGYMKVYKVYAESPADIQGVAVDDTITAINGQSTINMSVETAVDMLSGVSGESVDITYIHEGVETSATLVHKAYDASHRPWRKKEQGSRYERKERHLHGTGVLGGTTS